MYRFTYLVSDIYDRIDSSWDKSSQQKAWKLHTWKDLKIRFFRLDGTCCIRYPVLNPHLHRTDWLLYNVQDRFHLHVYVDRHRTKWTHFFSFHFALNHETCNCIQTFICSMLISKMVTGTRIQESVIDEFTFPNLLYNNNGKTSAQTIIFLYC